MRFLDGSSLTVPRQWSGRITDLQLVTPVVGSAASRLVSRSRSFASLSTGAHATTGTPAASVCMTMGEIRLNGVPYRRLPHELRRFTALALDNIRHDPWGYLTASAARAVRVFIIAGSEDTRTALQFTGAGRVYAIGRVASLAFLILSATGIWLVWRRGYRLLVLLAPIAYVPLTISFMLINARYSMTVQPFLFAFAAVPLVTAIDALSSTARHPVAQSR